MTDFLPSTALVRERCDIDRLWPLTVTRVAVSGLATVANGGTQQNLPEGVAAVLTVGVFSGVEIGLTGGSGDQWIPIFNADGFPLSDRTYYLAQRAATADGAVTVLGFATLEAMEYWKYLLSSSTPQQGAFASTGVAITGPLNVTSMQTDNAAGPGAASILDVEAFLRMYDAASNNWDLVRGLASVGDAITSGNVDRLLMTMAVGFLWNGTTYDRAASVASGAAAGRGRARTQDSWSAVGGRASGISTNTVATTTLYTAVGVAEVWVSIVLSAFTAPATLQVQLNGQVVAQYLTAAIGNVALNLGPYTLAATETIAVAVTAGGIGTAAFTATGKERAAL